MKHYSTPYEFKVEDKDLLSTGDCHISFYYDEETEEATKIDIELNYYEVWDVVKEEQVINILHHHIDTIKELLKEDAILYALAHDTY